MPPLNKQPAADWKQHNPTLAILREARRDTRGVIAPVAYTFDHVQAFVQAAKEAQQPMILQFFPWAVRFSSGWLIRAAALVVQQANVPIALHLDHCQDEAMVRYAAQELPFDSIMVDMSHFEREDNLRKTRELVELCHAHGVATEAEPGRIEGGEDGVMDTQGMEGLLTTVEELDAWIATGVDLLAPAVGNVHGEYGPQGPQLDWTRLARVHQRLEQHGVGIVLHGTNGFDEDTMRRCVQRGCGKINVNKLVLERWDLAVRAYGHGSAEDGWTAAWEQAYAQLVSDTARWMRVLAACSNPQPR